VQDLYRKKQLISWYISCHWKKNNCWLGSKENDKKVWIPQMFNFCWKISSEFFCKQEPIL